MQMTCAYGIWSRLFEPCQKCDRHTRRHGAREIVLDGKEEAFSGAAVNKASWPNSCCKVRRKSAGNRAEECKSRTMSHGVKTLLRRAHLHISPAFRWVKAPGAFSKTGSDENKRSHVTPGLVDCGCSSHISMRSASSKTRRPFASFEGW